MDEEQVLAARWQALAAEAFGAVQAWRRQHPTATLREIERAMDERLATMRARILQDTALTSRLADLRAAPVEARPPARSVACACGHADSTAAR